MPNNISTLFTTPEFTWLIVIAVLVGAAVVTIKFFKNSSAGDREARTEEKSSYRKKDYLLSIAERNFFTVLLSVATKNNYFLFTKVRLEDIVSVEYGVEKYSSKRNHIKSRHVDFLFCNKPYIKPLLAIELDDSSHSRPDRIERDHMVNDILRDANFPILHERAHQTYDPIELENRIKQKISTDSTL